MNINKSIFTIMLNTIVKCILTCEQNIKAFTNICDAMSINLDASFSKFQNLSDKDNLELVKNYIQNYERLNNLYRDSCQIIKTHKKVFHRYHKELKIGINALQSNGNTQIPFERIKTIKAELKKQKRILKALKSELKWQLKFFEKLCNKSEDQVTSKQTNDNIIKLNAVESAISEISIPLAVGDNLHDQQNSIDTNSRLCRMATTRMSSEGG